MVASTVSSSPSSPSSSPATPAHGRGWRSLLCAIHALVGVAAAVGGIVLVRDPTGAALGLSRGQLSGFSSFTIPAVLLLALAAVQLVCAVWALRPGARAMLVSQIGGGALVLWMAFQTALVAPVSPLQGLGLVLGALAFIVAHELYLETPHRKALP